MTAVPLQALPLSLSQALREGTREAHRMAENMRFVRAFLRGAVDMKTYARLLTAHAHVYAALETALDVYADHPVLGALRLPGLARHEALVADREFFADKLGVALDTEPGPAARRYAIRILEVANEQPALLAAHAYVRYLGDLSGGQVLGAVARRALGLPGRQGTGFYEFGSAEVRTELKTRFRAGLDAAPLDEREKAEIVAEAILVFRLNMDVFAELEGSALRTFWRLVFPRNPRGAPAKRLEPVPVP